MRKAWWGGVLASPGVSAIAKTSARGLLVLADGVHGAFAAGAVAELARRGARWDRGTGAGLGAHIALLALLDDAAEAERRWLREAALGCPMFESLLAAGRSRMGDARGLTLLPDPWSLAGWLDPAGLAEHLAPEMAATPQRLARRGATLAVAVEDLRRGTSDWVEFTTIGAMEAGAVLRAAAAFPGGWGPERIEMDGATRLFWGGVEAAFRGAMPVVGAGRVWDVVCGFPVPAVGRPAPGGALLELIQRRSEASAAAAVERWVDGAAAGTVRLVAPAERGWRVFSERDGADLGVEYPLPWDRNGELTAVLVGFGAFAVGNADVGRTE